MAALTGAKSFLEIQQEVSETVLGKAMLADTQSNPTLTQVKRIINDAEREICGKANWPWMKVEASFNLVKDQTAIYTLPDAVQELYWITIPSLNIKLTESSLETFNRMNPQGYINYQSGQPYSYVKGPVATNGAMQIYIWPAAQDNYTSKLCYKPRVANLSNNTDYPIIPPEFQDCLINLAISKAYLKQQSDNSNQFAKTYLDLYMAGFDEMFVKCMNSKEYTSGMIAEYNLPATGSVGNDTMLWNIATGGH